MMSKFSFLRTLGQWHRRSVTNLLLLVLVTLFVTLPAAAVPVALAPVPKLQFFDNSGRPLAFGCIFTYQSGTTTPLTTYTDYTGSIVNSNPVVLTAGGFAGTGSGGIWLQAGQAYTIKVVAAGGTLCASGVTQYSIDGIGGGLTILTTAITFSATPLFPIQAEIQMFTITLTGNAVAQPLTAVGILPPAHVIFQITQDGAGGHTFTWPSNTVGGAPIGLGIGQVTTQEFVWNGSNATAIGPATIGTGPALSAGSLMLSGQLISNLATGTAPFVIASTTKVVNLNVDQVDGCDWAIPCAIGSTTPNTGKFTTLEATTSFKLNGSTPATAVQGSTETKIMGAGTFSGATGDVICRDAAGGATDQSCKGAVTKLQAFSYCPSGCTITGTPCTTTAGAYNSCDDVISWPASFASTSYSATCTGVTAQNGGGAAANDVHYYIFAKATGTITFRTINENAEGQPVTFLEIDCHGIAP